MTPNQGQIGVKLKIRGQTHLDFLWLGAAVAFLHLDLEVSPKGRGTVQVGHALSDLQAAILLTAHVHGRVAHDVLLQAGGSGEHLVQVCRACRREKGGKWSESEMEKERWGER